MILSLPRLKTLLSPVLSLLLVAGSIEILIVISILGILMAAAFQLLTHIIKPNSRSIFKISEPMSVLYRTSLFPGLTQGLGCSLKFRFCHVLHFQMYARDLNSFSTAATNIVITRPIRFLSGLLS